MSASTAARVRKVLLEAWPPLLITAAMIVILRGIAVSNWEEIFLYNGDSITLPLLLKSLQAGEPFEWVFSTQTFLFPEFPIYAICELITGDPRVALALNACLNVLVLYGLFRGIVAFVAPGHRARQVLFALVAVSIFLACVASEPDVTIDPPGIVDRAQIATLFLLTTYYYGAILVALATLLLTLWFTDGFRFTGWTRRRIATFVAVTVVVTTLTAYSNPMLILVFTLPFVLVLLLVFFLRAVTFRWVAVILGSQVLGVMIGFGLREVFSQYIGASIGTYLASYQMQGAAMELQAVVGEWLQSPGGVLRLAVIAVPVIGSLAYLVQLGVRRVLARRSGLTTALPVRDIVITAFVVVSSTSLLAGQIATGQYVTRYLVPLFIFPLLSVLLLADEARFGRWIASRLEQHPALLRGAVAGVAALTIVASGVAVAVAAPRVTEMLSGADYDDTECLEEWLDGSSANGVATFWVARPLELYGDQRGTLAQVHTISIVHAWMNNLWSYENRDFSYLLLDNPERHDKVVAALGEPAQIVACEAYDIYDYAGTPGEATLNRSIKDTLALVTEGRDF